MALPGRADLGRPPVALREVRKDPSLPHPYWRHGTLRERCYWCGRRPGECTGYPDEPEVCFVPPRPVR